MSQKFDAAVIGTGPAGSIAGAYLAKAGLKTVVFEASDVIGGEKWGAYSKDGFSSCRSGHLPYWAMMSNGGGGWWAKAAFETGATLKWQCLPNSAIYFGGNIEVMPYCSNGDGFVQFMEALSPMPIPDVTKKELAKVFDKALAVPADEIWTEEMDTMPFRTWIDQVTDDEGAKLVFALVASLYLVSPAEFALTRSSAGFILGAFFDMITGRGNLVKMVHGTEDMVPNAFCDVTKNHGGQVLTNHKVTRVILERGQAKGVIVTDANGKETTYETDYVVVGSPYYSYKPLLGDNLPAEIKAITRGFDEVHNTALDVHFALKRRVMNPWWCQVLVLTDDGAYRGALFDPSFFEPTMAPPGKQLLQAEIFVATEEYRKRPQEEWVKHLTDMAEDVFPGVKEAIEWTHVHSVAPSVQYHYMSIRKVPLECPGIPNLYFVGDATRAPGAGTERAASSAMLVAKKILGT